MSALPNTSVKFRIPRSYLAGHVHDARARQHNSLTEAVYDLLATPMHRATLIAGVRDEWGTCTENELAAVLRSLRRAGNVRRRGGEYARTRTP